MGCTARGGDSIKITKRLLALTVVGAALVISAVLVVSLKGNDKPQITNDQPSTDEQPASTPPTAANTNPTSPNQNNDGMEIPTHHGKPVKPAEDTTGDNDNGNGNGNGNGHSPDGAKAHGLERAMEVHVRNMEKHDAKKGVDTASHDGKGLENSLDHLQTNLDKQSSHDVGADHGNGHGQANGNHNHP
jgi:hypothetical protein